MYAVITEALMFSASFLQGNEFSEPTRSPGDGKIVPKKAKNDSGTGGKIGKFFSKVGKGFKYVSL